LIEACLRIMIPRSSGICTVTSDIFDNMKAMDLRITEASYLGNLYSIRARFSNKKRGL
jgi:hypothetical protein